MSGPARGFISDLDALNESHLEGELTLIVEDGVVDGVEGDAPLACLLLVDRQLFEQRRALQFLSLRLQMVEDRLDP